ncbi:SRPBCC family protein [Arthrobacter sp. ISL-28]|uniref:SRPBCC family protein n=1 Tax=Arthrobacter sp. ISL-28 TaxID=2819108 RepID=UPI001BE9D198|nr:SRPBCC family protein [Arthrobacter sp. ISL-28]MBT2523510.1 SRPBCC family protein [Arthrobacter sp. ISL-28]
MAKVQESIDVNVPLSQAYNQWTQFEEFPRFMSGVDSVSQLDETTVHFRTDIAGIKRDFNARIIDQVPDERITWESVDEPHNSGIVSFQALSPTDTRVSVDVTWEPDSAVERVGASLHLDDRQIKNDLQRFKEFIEGREVETGAWRGTIADGKVED